MRFSPATVILQLRALARRWRVENAAVAAEVARANVARLRWLLLAMLVLNLVHVATFWQAGPADSAAVVDWKRAILATHAVMALIAASLAAAAWHLCREGSRAAPWAWALCCQVVAVAALVFAGVLACVDQLVTPNITPFVLASVLVGTVVQQRPALAALIYGAALWAFGGALGLVQPDPNLLLSNRVNALTAVVLGWLLGSMNWRRTATTVLLGRALAQRQAELEQQQRELQRLATRDGLTGLLNRVEMQRLCTHELALARRHRLPVSLLLIDLDHFKRINDRWGHPAGDAMLVACADRLIACVRSSDLVARLGGEEFILKTAVTQVLRAPAAGLAGRCGRRCDGRCRPAVPASGRALATAPQQP